MTVDTRPFVLIVDRNRNSALMLSKRLEALGYRADFVPSAETLIEFLKASPKGPDMILVDIIDSNSSSLELPAMIAQQTPYGKTIPMAVHTTLADRAHVVKAVDAGFSDYIIRPIEPEIFKDRIEKLVHKKPELATETFQRPIFEPGIIELDIVVDVINEFGLKIHAFAPLPANTVISVTSPVLRTLGLNPAKMRVMGSEKKPDDSNHPYLITLSFIGLSAIDHRRIRHYAIQGTKKDAS